MFILSIIFVELLVVLAVVGQMYYLHREIGCTYNQISIGMNPKLYTKNYKGVDFKFSLLPFYILSYNFKDISYSKFFSLNKYLLAFVTFFCIAIPHSVIIFSLCDSNFWYIFYKTLITTQITDAEMGHINYHLSRLSVQPIKFFIVVVSSSAMVYIWYVLVIRDLCDTVLDTIAKKFNNSFNALSKYLVSTAIIFYLYFTGSIFNILFIFIYDSMAGGLIDWLIAHCILMVILAAMIEVLSRISQKNIEN